MHPTPAISVVLPYFNAEKTLARAISSVLEQTFPDFELILINNNSSDGSEKIAAAFEAKDPRIKRTREEQQGVAFASNRGFDQGRAAIIARMDADDRMLPHRLEQQMQFLRIHPNIDMVGGQVKYLSNEANEGFRHYVIWSNQLISPTQIALNRFVELPVVNPTIMFRKTLYERHGGYHNGDFPEDYDLILRWMEQGASVAKIAAPVLEWHDHPTRLTRTDPRYSTTAFFKVKAKYLAHWMQQNVNQKEVWIWGAGKLSRRRSHFLEEYGILIQGFIDVKRRQLDKPCIDFKQIPEPGRLFILSYVSNRGKREEVKQYLLAMGYVEGKDFLLAA